MSKLYMMNRMRHSPAAGDIFGTLLKLGGGLVKGAIGAFKGKTVQTVVKGAKYAMTSPAAQAALAAGAGGLAGALMAPGGGGGGASGGWRGRRRKGITATELRGFRKVAKLLHNEGMVIKKRRKS
jgi:hypothetical protein